METHFGEGAIYCRGTKWEAPVCRDTKWWKPILVEALFSGRAFWWMRSLVDVLFGEIALWWKGLKIEALFREDILKLKTLVVKLPTGRSAFWWRCSLMEICSVKSVIYPRIFFMFTLTLNLFYMYTF